jgi:hypothetical protein
MIHYEFLSTVSKIADLFVISGILYFTIASYFYNKDLPGFAHFFYTSYIWDRWDGWSIIIFLILYVIFKIYMIFLKKLAFMMGFSEVKDLIRGSITAELNEVESAYKHFLTTPGLKIIEIKNLEKIHDLRNITVIYVFDEKFIGEMQFKFTSDNESYNANHFIYEIYRSRMKIEILQALNRRAITMSQEGKLTSHGGR